MGLLAADAAELKEVERQLLECAKRGVDCDRPVVPGRAAILARLKAARPATHELRERVSAHGLDHDGGGSFWGCSRRFYPLPRLFKHAMP